MGGAGPNGVGSGEGVPRPPAPAENAAAEALKKIEIQAKAEAEATKAQAAKNLATDITTGARTIPPLTGEDAINGLRVAATADQRLDALGENPSSLDVLQVAHEGQDVGDQSVATSMPTDSQDTLDVLREAQFGETQPSAETPAISQPAEAPAESESPAESEVTAGEAASEEPEEATDQQGQAAEENPDQAGNVSTQAEQSTKAGEQQEQNFPATQAGNTEPGTTPPPATAAEEATTAEQDAAEKLNKAAKELLINDPNAVKYLENLTDLQNLDVAKKIEELEAKAKTDNKLTEKENKLLQRLQEVQGRALRQDAQATLDEMNRNGVDKNSPEYKAARQQFEAHATEADKNYIRETIRQDGGLSKMLADKGYDIEDFDIDKAEQQEGKSDLGDRLRALKSKSEMAVLQDGADYDANPEQREERMKKIAKAGEHLQNLPRRVLNKINDTLAKFSGAEIHDAFNQAKGWKQVMKGKEQLLKDPNLDPKRRKEIEKDIEYAKKLRIDALKKAIGLRAGKTLFLLFILFSAALVVGPAILPAKLMEWGGKGAGR